MNFFNKELGIPHVEGVAKEAPDLSQQFFIEIQIVCSQAEKAKVNRFLAGIDEEGFQNRVRSQSLKDYLEEQKDDPYKKMFEMLEKIDKHINENDLVFGLAKTNKP